MGTFFDVYLMVELLFLLHFVGFNLYNRLLLLSPLHILRNQGSTYCEEERATKSVVTGLRLFTLFSISRTTGTHTYLWYSWCTRNVCCM